MNYFKKLPYLALFSMALNGCAIDADGEAMDGQSMGGSGHIETSEVLLAPGDSGALVLEVHDYLEQFGYLENADLLDRYPSWRPVTDARPLNPSVYDEEMSKAVGAFQARVGLTPSGLVDAETLALMRTPRCEVPESGAEHDSDEKFALWGSEWNKTSLTWSLSNVGSGLTRTNAENAIAAAFATWAASSGLTFSKVSAGTASDIVFTFGSVVAPALATAQAPANGGDVTFGSSVSWSTASTPPSGQYDLQSVALHEIGHALGLAHSSITPGTPVMNSLIGSGSDSLRRSLTTDDQVAIRAAYGVWRDVGTATDVDVNKWGTAWKIGTTLVAGGFDIHKYNGSGWTSADGGAVRIAVDSYGTPWVINSAGTILKRKSTAAGTAGWFTMPGCGKEIAIGDNNSIWLLGCNSVPGGYGIFRWNGTGWDAAAGGATKIAVDENGKPWIVNSSNVAFSGTVNASWTSWVARPGCARDIDVSQTLYPWIIGCDSQPGGYGIWVWNQQAEASLLGHSAPAREEWVRSDGGATKIAVGAPARPWLINSSGRVFRAF